MNHTQAREGLCPRPNAARTYAMVRAILAAVLVTPIIFVVVTVLRVPVSVPVVAVLAGLVLAVDLIFIRLGHPYYRYMVTGREFHVARGRFILTTVTVAVSQILHAEVSQGPLLRLFDLAEVRVKMVVGGHDLGPVAPSEAERIRLTILRGAGSAAIES